MTKSERVFVREITSEHYDLKDVRDAQLAAPRVRNDSVVVDDGKVGHSGDSAKSKTWRRLGPADAPFLPQTLQVHFVELPPQSANNGHGHQNEAAFYILEGRGYEIHDDKRYDWGRGDLALCPPRPGPPPLQPVRRAGGSPGDEGQEHVDVHGPDPAGPQRADRPS